MDFKQTRMYTLDGCGSGVYVNVFTKLLPKVAQFRPKSHRPAASQHSVTRTSPQHCPGVPCLLSSPSFRSCF